MKELKSLNELQIAKLYNKTNDQKYLDEIDMRIAELYENNINPDKLSNEQLVLLCQKYGDSKYWDALYNKTKNSIHYCINKYANSFYKAEYTNAEDKESTDLFSIIRLGWLKAVETYNIVKGNAGFVAYASTLMYQHYIKLTRQVNQKHNGTSVNSMYIESIRSTSVNESDNAGFKNKMVDTVYTDNNSHDIATYEAEEYIKQKMIQLKEYDETMYNIVILHYFRDMTQVQIAEKFGRNKTWVSRKLKRAKQFMKAKITDEEYLQIIKDLNK